MFRKLKIIGIVAILFSLNSLFSKTDYNHLTNKQLVKILLEKNKETYFATCRLLHKRQKLGQTVLQKEDVPLLFRELNEQASSGRGSCFLTLLYRQNHKYRFSMTRKYLNLNNKIIQRSILKALKYSKANEIPEYCNYFNIKKDKWLRLKYVELIAGIALRNNKYTNKLKSYLSDSFSDIRIIASVNLLQIKKNDLAIQIIKRSLHTKNDYYLINYLKGNIVQYFLDDLFWRLQNGKQFKHNSFDTNHILELFSSLGIKAEKYLLKSLTLPIEDIEYYALKYLSIKPFLNSKYEKLYRKALEDKESNVRFLGAKALYKIGFKKIATDYFFNNSLYSWDKKWETIHFIYKNKLQWERLLKQLKKDFNRSLNKGELDSSLLGFFVRIGEKEYIQYLPRLLNNTEPKIGSSFFENKLFTAFEILKNKLPLTKKYIPLLIKSIADKNKDAIMVYGSDFWLIQDLGKIAVPYIVDYLEQNPESINRNLQQVLENLARDAAYSIPYLIKTRFKYDYNEHPNYLVLARIGKPALTELVKLLKSGNRKDIFFALRAVRFLDVSSAELLSELSRLSYHKSKIIRHRALYALAGFNKAAVPYFSKIIKSAKNSKTIINKTFYTALGNMAYSDSTINNFIKLDVKKDITKENVKTKHLLLNTISRLLNKKDFTAVLFSLSDSLDSDNKYLIENLAYTKLKGKVLEILISNYYVLSRKERKKLYDQLYKYLHTITNTSNKLFSDQDKLERLKIVLKLIKQLRKVPNKIAFKLLYLLKDSKIKNNKEMYSLVVATLTEINFYPDNNLIINEMKQKLNKTSATQNSKKQKTSGNSCVSDLNTNIFKYLIQVSPEYIEILVKKIKVKPLCSDYFTILKDYNWYNYKSLIALTKFNHPLVRKNVSKFLADRGQILFSKIFETYKKDNSNDTLAKIIATWSYTVIAKLERKLTNTYNIKERQTALKVIANMGIEKKLFLAKLIVLLENKSIDAESIKSILYILGEIGVYNKTLKTLITIQLYNRNKQIQLEAAIAMSKIHPTKQVQEILIQSFELNNKHKIKIRILNAMIEHKILYNKTVSILLLFLKNKEDLLKVEILKTLLAVKEFANKNQNFLLKIELKKLIKSSNYTLRLYAAANLLKIKEMNLAIPIFTKSLMLKSENKKAVDILYKVRLLTSK